MRYKRSTLLGSGIVFAVVLISILVFYLSQGPCHVGFFSCDNGTSCILKKKVCDNNVDCDDGSDESYHICSDADDLTLVSSFLKNMSLAENIASEIALGMKCERDPISRCEYCPSYQKQHILDLHCYELGLKEIPKLKYKNIETATFANNSLELTEDSLKQYSDVKILHLSFNSIKIIPPGVFKNMTKLTALYLAGNLLTHIEKETFEGLSSIRWLFLEMNKIVSVDFIALPEVGWIDLSDNNLTEISLGEMPKLKELFLYGNKITKITKELFAGTPNLQTLELHNNQIQYISPGAFGKLKNLINLELSMNQLTAFPENACRFCPKLQHVLISHNPMKIQKDSLKYCQNVTKLYLEGIDEKSIDFSTFNDLKPLKFIFFDKFHFCSFVPQILHCEPDSDGISSLKDLVSKPALRPVTWLVAILTLTGNTLVLCGRSTGRDENRALSLVIRNLAVSDMLMGVYLLIMGIQDVRFRNEYNKYSHEWTSSWTCTLVGATAMTSSVVSLLILAFMSVERFLLIVDPLGGHPRLTARIAKQSLSILWIVGISLAVIPIIHWRNTTRFYGMYSGMCFPLHLMEKFPVGWQYSAFIFLGVNSVGLMIITGVYFAMFISVWQTRKAVPSSSDFEFAIRFFFIVLTNVVCWAPIVCLKIATFLNAELSTDVYAWLVVFVVPLNSAVNPLLYTFTTPKYRDQLLSFSWKYTAKRSSIGADTESSRASSSKNIVCAVVSSGNSNMRLDSTTTHFNSSTTSVNFKL